VVGQFVTGLTRTIGAGAINTAVNARALDAALAPRTHTQTVVTPPRRLQPRVLLFGAPQPLRQFGGGPFEVGDFVFERSERGLLAVTARRRRIPVLHSPSREFVHLRRYAVEPPAAAFRGRTLRRRRLT